MQRTEVWEDRRVEAHKWRDAIDEFELSPLQLRAIVSRAHAPQAVDGDKWLLVNICVPSFVRKRIVMQRVSILINNERAVLLHEGVLDEQLDEYIALHPKYQSSPTGVLAMTMDLVTERFAPVLDEFDEVVDDLEDAIMDDTIPDDIDLLFDYKKMLMNLRRTVLSTMLLIDTLTDGRFGRIDEQYYSYLRDSYDYAWRAHELIDSSRDLLSSVLSVHMNATSNRMNDVMKRLTLVTSVFMPISFLASLGGINFMQFPFAQDWAYALLMALMVVLPPLMFLYFWRKKWF